MNLMRMRRLPNAVLSVLAGALLWTQGSVTPVQGAEPSSNAVRIVKVEGPAGAVEILAAGTTVWDRARDDQVLHMGDRLMTREHGRITLRWTDNSTVRLPPFSELEIEAGPDARSAGFNLLKGLLYFFHRDGPTQARFRTRWATAAIRGTEFVLEFQEPDSRTVLTVLDGEVEIRNAEGQANLASGTQGMAEPGSPPRKTAVIEAVNLVQWCLYYPGVLDVEDLDLSPAEKDALAGSLAAYRSGDLPGALAQYPAGRVPGSAEEKVYRAAVLLAAGEVAPAEAMLAGDGMRTAGDYSRTERLAGALRKMIAAVKLQALPSTLAPQPSAQSASEWLAESYCQQSRSKLPEALQAARRAAGKSPRFGLAQARVAELEFSFGNIREALRALEHGLSLSPRNAQAVALQGFLLAAQNRAPAALECFERAIRLDGALGNAWLGRGLCKIRQGRIAEGRDDLQVAATLEPQRALLRSYLGKAYSAAGANELAARELKLAMEKDPRDPTAWLYSALLEQQENRVNQAVSDLEKATELNDHRSVYRSGVLLDQDLGVKRANLASIYRDTGMPEVSLWEAAKAVNVDPANYSAHLFLANSYYEMLDLPLYQQRYEAARVNEYLTATLLAPVGAGLLSQPVSAQEYGRLFERDGLGLYSSTDYLSRGAWQQYAAQHGRFGDTSYSFDGYYAADPGQRSNNDLEQLYGTVQLKQQFTPADSLYLQAVWSQAEYGDLSQVQDPETQGNRQVRHKETQEPLLFLGYHHEWSPGNHTLLLGGRLQDTLEANDPLQQTPVVSHLDSDTFEFTPVITGVTPLATPGQYRSELEVYSIEVQQIHQRESHALIGGGRYQTGTFDTLNTQSISDGSSLDPDWFTNPAQHFRPAMERFNLYGYAHWQVARPLRLIAGLSYDWLKYPENFRFAPISAGETIKDQVSPKGGFIWTPFTNTTLRAAYSRSLGGASLDQSVQLEPSQVAGFNQAWRSLIPESVAGANAAAEFETWNISFEQRLPTRTYLGLGGEILNSSVDRLVGAFEMSEPEVGVFPLPPFIHQSGLQEHLNYQERSMTFTLNQLLGEGWAFGARYRLSQAELDSQFPAIPVSADLGGGLERQRNQSALLHQVRIHGTYTHRKGLFGLVEAVWFLQDDSNSIAAGSREEFWQVNAFLGYHFPRRQAEVRVGLLNLTGQDYRLNPLNLTAGLPRERTFQASFRFSF